jgi:hypothetical protein
VIKKLGIIFLAVLISVSAVGQGKFQKSRKSVQKARFGGSLKRYGRACEVFEKRRVKGEKKPIINLGLGRKRKPKLAEQE